MSAPWLIRDSGRPEPRDTLATGRNYEAVAHAHE